MTKFSFRHVDIRVHVCHTKNNLFAYFECGKKCAKICSLSVLRLRCWCNHESNNKRIHHELFSSKILRWYKTIKYITYEWESNYFRFSFSPPLRQTKVFDGEHSMLNVESIGTHWTIFLHCTLIRMKHCLKLAFISLCLFYITGLYSTKNTISVVRQSFVVLQF